jgi:hypothetical protein
MQIGFSVSVGAVTLFEIVLTGGRCITEEVQDISHGMNQLAQTEAGIDGANLHLYGRGGRSFTFSFVGIRQHADNDEAAGFSLTHPDTMPAGHGAVSITAGGTTKSYARGLVTRCEVSQNFVETRTRYEILITKATT